MTESQSTKLAVKEWAAKIPELFRTAQAGVRGYIEDLTQKPEVRFRTVLWAICIMFVGFFTLVGTNPFRLLVPDAFFHPPAQDARESVAIYGISLESGKTVRIQRYLDLSVTGETRLRRIAAAVSQPPGLQEGLGDSNYADLMPLPDLHLSIRAVWFPNKQQDTVIIDLRAESLSDEVDRFLANREGTERSDNTELLDAYFRALTASLFEQMPAIGSLDYLIDGERRSVPGMQFDLSRRYTRGAGDQG